MIIKLNNKKIINFADGTKENKKEHSPKLAQILYHPCKILIIGNFRSGKKFNLTAHERNADKIN